MKANLRKISKQRFYSEDFKKKIVSDFESGKYSALELVALHKIAESTVYRWIYKFSTFNKQGFRVVEMKQSSSQKVRELERQIKELEAAVGRKQITIDYLETMIEVAKDELKIDIKKNYSTPQSTGSKKNVKK